MNNISFTPNPNDNGNKQFSAIINVMLAKIDKLEKRIELLEATKSNDIKPRITSD